MPNFILPIYIALPAFVANMSPVIIARLGWLKKLDWPLDSEKTWRGKRIFGPGKTWRGIVAGVLGAMATALIQWLVAYFDLIVIAPYSVLGTSVAYGFLAGCGALLGDAAASFVKRRVGIARGRPFIPFDQIDYIIGFLIFTYPFIRWSGYEMAILLIFALIANPLANLIAYFLRIKTTYW